MIDGKSGLRSMQCHAIGESCPRTLIGCLTLVLLITWFTCNSMLKSEEIDVSATKDSVWRMPHEIDQYNRKSSYHFRHA